MIRTLTFLFCDNEHGCGDVTFPDADEINPYTIVHHSAANAKHLRREARKAGWRVHRGADYCPDCVDCELNAKGGR